MRPIVKFLTELAIFLFKFHKLILKKGINMSTLPIGTPGGVIFPIVPSHVAIDMESGNGTHIHHELPPELERVAPISWGMRLVKNMCAVAIAVIPSAAAGIIASDERIGAAVGVATIVLVYIAASCGGCGNGLSTVFACNDGNMDRLKAQSADQQGEMRSLKIQVIGQQNQINRLAEANVGLSTRLQALERRLGLNV